MYADLHRYPDCDENPSESSFWLFPILCILLTLFIIFI